MVNIWMRRGHCLYCMTGGDSTTQHTAVRDVHFDFCERAGLRPISEAPHILQDIFTRDGRCRPADVLCIPALVVFCPLDPERFARSQSVWTQRSSIRWAWPGVHEIQCGMAKGADAAMRAICETVGQRESMDAATVRVVHGPPGSGDYSHRNEGGEKNLWRSSAL